MAPVPFRGVECGPEFTVFVAQELSRVCEAAPETAQREELLTRMHETACALLDRKPTTWQQAHAHEAYEG